MTSNVFGNWVKDRILGSGGFGQVELWKEKDTNNRKAIKRCMLPRQEISERQAIRWKKEIEIMQKLKHPNIVKAVAMPDVMSFDFPVLCMEFCNKGNLRKVLNEPTNVCGLVQCKALAVMKDISSALKYLHYNNFTHRDLKPENIVLHERNNVITYKLIDLGFAKELGSNTRTASQVGTFNYVAPELFYQNRYTCSVDYWSLGILFFEVLTGYKPFVPLKQNLVHWINSLKNKKYNEVCAKEIDGEIQFFDHMIHVTDLSECLLNKFVEWFKIVFQWNPRTRGKHPDSNENVFFHLLKEIFPKMTIHVFSVALYQIDQYDIYNDTKVVELQQWIEQQTSLSRDKQIIVNSNGQVLDASKHSKNLTFEDIPNSILYVYDSESLEVINFDSNWKLPSILDDMLTDPEQIKDQISLRQCYTSLIYIMRHEVNLFEQYILALGTKYDVIKVDIDIFNQNIYKSLSDIESLLFKVKETLTSSESSNMKRSLNDLLGKIAKIHKALNNTQCEVERFMCELNNFFGGEKLFKDVQKYRELYDHFLYMFGEFEMKRSCDSEYISSQIDSLTDSYGEFDSLKETLLKDEQTVIVLRKLVQFKKNLVSYTNLIDASTKLIPSYERKFAEILSENTSITMVLDNTGDNTNNTETNLSLVTNDDSEIKDNIVLRLLFDDYLRNVQENWSRIKSDLDTI